MKKHNVVQFSRLEKVRYALIGNAVAADTERLSELNKRCIVSICDFLGIHTAIETDDGSCAPLEERLSMPETGLRLEVPRIVAQRV